MKQKNTHFKKFIFPMLGILIVALLILAGNFLNPESPEPAELQTEELPLPEQNKQGEPEITKLNSNSQIKEGW